MTECRFPIRLSVIRHAHLTASCLTTDVDLLRISPPVLLGISPSGLLNRCTTDNCIQAEFIFRTSRIRYLIIQVKMASSKDVLTRSRVHSTALERSAVKFQPWHRVFSRFMATKWLMAMASQSCSEEQALEDG